MGIMTFLLLSVIALPVNTKGMDDEKVWDISFQGDGNAPFFQSSVVMELDLKGDSTKEDVMIFINKQKWEGDWDYDQNLKVTFREEGTYVIHLIHRNGYEETRKIVVELDNPSQAKIDTRSYKAGTWTKHHILLKAYGAKAVSKISYYEYKIGDGEWKKMQQDQLEISENLDEQVFVRAVSNTGREGEISKVWCRLWKNAPSVPKIICDKRSIAGWYDKIPNFSYEMEETKGVPVHVYAKLTKLDTKQSQTEIDQIPQIKKDGRYQLKIWAKDEAGNQSKTSDQTICFVDTKKPEIFVEYENVNNMQGVLRYQKAKIKVRDENLLKRSLKLETSGQQEKAWRQEGDFYQTEVVFSKDGKQDLKILAQDLAGNSSIREEKEFKIDTKKPEIYIDGIINGKSYKKPVNPWINVKDDHKDPQKIHVYLNGKEWMGTKINEDGYYTLEVQAEDMAGNKNNIVRKFTLNQKGIDIRCLQKNLQGKNIATRDLKPGFKIESLEPVQVTEFLVNGQKVQYQWKQDEVYVKEPIMDNGRCDISLHVKDANGEKKSSEKITFFYDTKNPVIKIKGLDQKNECEYGKEIVITLENTRDEWKEATLDGKDLHPVKGVISLKKLEPGIHTIHLNAQDLAGNITDKNIKIKVNKILPEPIKKIMEKSSTKKDTKEKKKGTKESYLWIIPGMVIFLLAAIMVYTNALNCRKYKDS